MFKTILFPTDGSDQSKKALEYAVHVAKSYGAVINALFVVDIKSLEGPFFQDVAASCGMIPYADYQGKIQEIMQTRGNQILKQVEEVCINGKVRCKTDIQTGVISTVIAEQANLADLIILGRHGEHAMFNDIFLGSTTENLLRHTHKPVIVVGKKAPEAISNILLAYDGSEQASQALAVAANVICETKAKLSLIIVGKSKEDNEKIWIKAKDYLDPYKIEVNKILKEKDGVSENILKEAKNKKCDLIIMGAFKHTKLYDMIIESTTQHVLHEALCPVLLIR